MLPAAYLAPIPPSLAQSNFHLLIRPMFLVAPPESKERGRPTSGSVPFEKYGPLAWLPTRLTY